MAGNPHKPSRTLMKNTRAQDWGTLKYSAFISLTRIIVQPHWLP
jgi:hypothetical protein